MAETRNELLEIWRSVLYEIEKRLAMHGGDSQAPLHLVSQRDQARAEIERLEGQTAPSIERVVPSSTDIATRLDYQFQIENLRRDIASWQSSISHELVSMTEDQVKPLQAMLFEMGRRLDAITAALTTIKEDQAVIMHRLGVLEVASSSSDGSRARWLIHLSVAILVVTVAMLAGHYLKIGSL